jgi:hypothetical protein
VATKIYGYSNDNVEVEGGPAAGDYWCYDTDDSEHGVLLTCSDGTVLEAKYGKGQMGIWGVTLIRKGDMFDRIDQCEDEDAKIHSDVAHFTGELKWVMAASDWEKVS